MPRINIHEHSDTYSFQVRNKAYACVALPITAIWGPVYDSTDEDTNPDWLHFEAGYRGTTDFVNTFRGANTALGSREKSYDYALKLLAAGYDILVKRADGQGAKAARNLIFNKKSPYTNAGAKIEIPADEEHGVWPAQTVQVRTDQSGALGNRLKVWVQFLNYATDAEIDKTATPWKFKADFRQEAIVRVYLVNTEQEGLECMTIQPTDTLLESHSVSWTYPAGNFANRSVPIDIYSGGFVTGMTVNAACANRCPRSSFIMTLGVTAEGSDPDITHGQTWTQTATAVGSGDENFGQFSLTAKYPGTFGNQLKVRIKIGDNAYGKKIGTVEVFNRNGYTDSPNKVIKTDQLLEMQSVAFDISAATDAQPYITEAVFSNIGTVGFQHEDLLVTGSFVTSLLGGNDMATLGQGIPTTTPIDTQIMTMVMERYSDVNLTFPMYIRDCVGNSSTTPATEGSASAERIMQIWNQQKVYQNATAMIGELTDPLTYDWDALFMGIMDDQYIPQSWLELHPEITPIYEPTQTQLKMLEVAANSKCGAALIGTPFGLKRGTVSSTGIATGAIKFLRDLSAMAGPSLSTFGELVGPWCKTTLPINGANSWITPELAHLLLIINAQGIGGQNKWWMVPAGMLGTGVVHTPEYAIKKAYLDIIQDHDEGTCMNPLMQVPGKGFTCFGNSTLWNKPLGTYNALQNLSTRLLTNRVKQRIWDTALQILFKYNNENAYSHFYAGVSPLLDEMRAVGALTSTESNPWGYRIIMNPDIINLDRINANTVIGRVELAVTGVIDTVDVDLFLLPPTAFAE